MGRAAKLKGFEAIRAVHLVEEQFRWAVRWGTAWWAGCCWVLLGAAGCCWVLWGWKLNAGTPAPALLGCSKACLQISLRP